MKRVLSLVPTLTAGIVAILVGFTSAIAILFQAGKAIGASPEQTSSMIAALCFGAGLTSIAFSYYYKKPFLMAFSTTGAALLATTTTHAPFSEIIGAFAAAAVLIIASGLTGWFERILNRIPMGLTSAMLAGVLVRFGLDIFTSMKTQPVLVGAMILSYLVCKRWYPRYAVIAVLVTGLFASFFGNLVHLESFSFKLSTPIFTMPAFSLTTILGIGLPLFIVTMAAQNLPGIAVLRAAGYHPPISPIITGTGFATLLLAPFGAFGINFAAITAAIVTGPEAHEDSSRRYIASTTAGVLHLLVGVFAATVCLFFQALPIEFVLSLAGIALIGTIATSLTLATQDASSREPAVLTFLFTVSGLSLFGIGSAFWGLVVGGLALFAFRSPSRPIP